MPTLFFVITCLYRQIKACYWMIRLCFPGKGEGQQKVASDDNIITSTTVPPQAQAGPEKVGYTDTKKEEPTLLSAPLFLWCPEQESNLHASRHAHLKRARLPFRHLGKNKTSLNAKGTLSLVLAENELNDKIP